MKIKKSMKKTSSENLFCLFWQYKKDKNEKERKALLKEIANRDDIRLHDLLRLYKKESNWGLRRKIVQLISNSEKFDINTALETLRPFYNRETKKVQKAMRRFLDKSSNR